MDLSAAFPCEPLPLRESDLVTNEIGARNVAQACAPRRPGDHLPLREVIARSIYDERPYSVAESGGVMEPLREARVLSWAEAPDWYRNECYDLADGIAGRLMLAAAARRGADREAMSRAAMLAELTRRMEPWGASKRIAFETGTHLSCLFAMRAGRQRISEKVAEWLGYRFEAAWVPYDALGEAVLDGCDAASAGGG